MKALFSIVALIVLAAAGYYLLDNQTITTPQGNTSTTTPMNTSTTTPRVTPISHATVLLEWDSTTIYTDPTDAALLSGKPPADIVLITDIHGDHLSTSTLQSVVGSSTSLIVPQAVKDLLPPALASRAKVLSNDATLTDRGFTIKAIPMYNLPDADNADRHTKGRGNGYVISRNNFDVYVAGDTAGTPEMRALAGIDVAFVPMNMPFTMTVQEAAEAVLAFKSRTVYPYHYRGQDGLADVDTFKELVNAGDPAINVVLANWYPQE
jgi:L-ascorbate metabolism protein UlaG (beta-lactamase superfamily)